MSKFRKISVLDYANHVGKTARAIQLSLKDGKKLDGVKSAERVGKIWVLTVDF